VHVLILAVNHELLINESLVFIETHTVKEARESSQLQSPAGYIRDEQKANEAACFDYREKMSFPVCAESVLGWLGPR